MRITSVQRDEIVAHAREEAPNECCGYMRLKDGAVVDVVRAQNKHRSPYRFELDDASLMTAAFLEDEGFGVGIYHSHPRSPAEPSQTDINVAQYPGWVYVIVSLEGGEPQVRAWRIADGRVEEEEIVVARD
jgi:proteasome lid subunit RPN8/RPN11